MIDKYSQFVRWYRRARRQYHLAAVDAVSYARDRALLRSSDSPFWGVDVDPDADHGLIVFTYEECDHHDAHVLDSLGGVDVSYEMSDHGNILVDLEDPYLVSIVADMVRFYVP